jgi:hypothetical protein
VWIFNRTVWLGSAHAYAAIQPDQTGIFCLVHWRSIAMTHWTKSFTRLTLAAAILATPLLVASTPVAAGQPWTCVCGAVKKRYIASTGHCEFRNKLPKGQLCSMTQYRAVYTPYCVKQGCRLAR